MFPPDKPQPYERRPGIREDPHSGLRAAPMPDIPTVPIPAQMPPAWSAAAPAPVPYTPMTPPPAMPGVQRPVFPVPPPAANVGWRPVSPIPPAAPNAAMRAVFPVPPPAVNASAWPGQPLPPRPGTATPPRPPARPNAGYRGLPLPVRVAGFLAFAVAVGFVLGATAPTALVRIGAVAAIQPGLLAWYSVRALGFLAYIVLAGSVLYGLLLSTKILDAIAHRPVSFALHKDLAIVALILGTLHGGLLTLDQSFNFTPASLIVPFASPYSPITVGIGQLTLYGTAVITASFYVRRRIGQRAWRLLHYVTFLVFIGATAHGIGSGSDSGTPWAFWLYLSAIAAAVFLTTYRVVISMAARRHRRPVLRPGAAGTPLVVARAQINAKAG